MDDLITVDAMEKRCREVQKQEEALREQLAKANREKQAITLYLQAMRGQLPAGNSRARGPDKSRTRAERGEQRAKMLALLADRPEGYTWEEMKDLSGVAAGLAESRLYHALQNMRRSKLVQYTDEKRYILNREAQPLHSTKTAA